MDRLVAEKEVETLVETQKVTVPKQVENKVENTMPTFQTNFDGKFDQNNFVYQTQKVEEKKPLDKMEGARIESYVQSFENVTLGDIKKEKEQKEAADFLSQKDQLIEEQYTPSQPQENQTIIEKPNYDLIEENPKIVKLKSKQKKQNKPKKNFGKIALACALGASALVCVVNTALIDNMQAAFYEINETYNVNLRTYLKNIANLDSTKKSMEFIETYPDENLDAGDVGKKTNWFDNICNFIGGMFGG